VGGHGGVFEVRLDGDLVFTNDRVCGVPEPSKIVEAVRAALG
jgi:predicted Rdx family selenoprotein